MNLPQEIMRMLNSGHLMRIETEEFPMSPDTPLSTQKEIEEILRRFDNHDRIFMLPISQKGQMPIPTWFML